MKLSLVTNGISIGARAVVELRDPSRALMADLSTAYEILHLLLYIVRVPSPVSPYTNNVTAMVKVFIHDCLKCSLCPKAVLFRKFFHILRHT